MQGFVNFLQQKYDAALEYFSKALLEKPSCGAKMRMAISYCCFMLQQYDRAKAAADVAISMEVNFSNTPLLR